MYCGFYNIIYVSEKTVLLIFSFLFQYQKHYLHKMLDRILLELINWGFYFKVFRENFIWLSTKAKVLFDSF